MRIVGGAAKGRRLAPPADGTRPTADRTREALYNSLDASMNLAGARVLDLYAGTGAVGLEALSRGAVEAVFVERNRAALSGLHRNIDTVGLPGAHVITRAVSSYLGAQPDQPFDLVFADPPYTLPETKVFDVLVSLTAPGWLTRDAFVVLERPARSGGPRAVPAELTPVGERRYGDSVLWYGRPR